MKDTEKALKKELSRIFIGQGQRLTMMSKLVLAVIKMCTVNFAQLALVINPKVQVSGPTPNKLDKVSIKKKNLI